MIRCGVIGLGRIGSLLEDDQRREKPCTHAGAFRAHPSCELVGGYDINAERRAHFTARWGVATDYHNAQDFLRRAKLQLLSIATHPDSHSYLVALAARHHVPVVICEKPLADSVRRSRAIVQIHRRRRCRIVVNHERRYATNWQGARRAIQSGTYGSLLSMWATLYCATTAKDSMLLHDGTHLFDLLRFLTGGELFLRTKSGSIRGAQSSLYIILNITPSRCAPNHTASLPCVVEIGAERDHLLFEIGCSFSQGRMVVGNGYQRAEKSVESPYYESFRSLDNSPFRSQSDTGYFINMVEDAVRCVQNPEAEPLSSAIDGYRVIQLLAKIGLPHT